MQAQFDHADQARFVVMGMGMRARVLKPLELRRAVEEEVNGMLTQMNEEAGVSRP
jgi:hypothetical protein